MSAVLKAQKIVRLNNELTALKYRVAGDKPRPGHMTKVWLNGANVEIPTRVLVAQVRKQIKAKDAELSAAIADAEDRM